jgi:hypothetical protein
MKKLYFLLFTILISIWSFGQTTVFINEIHYDNAGTSDVDEGFEIAGPAGTDLTNWTVAKYNGSNNLVYGTENLSGTIPDEGSGYGAIWFGLPTNGLQNGAPDGLALVAADGTTVIQFLSYEGTITALDGPANTLTSTDIGVSETSTTPAGESLQLTGSGNIYENFTWTGPTAHSRGLINSGQSFTAASCGVILGSATYVCSTNTLGDNNDGVTIQIPYTGSDADITSVTTTSSGSVFGDDPASDVDGTIVITGLSEGDAWDITLNGGDCDGSTTSGTVPAAECDPTPNTCFDISGGSELFELVAVTTNSELDEWTESSGVYAMNGYCGSTCTDESNTWLIFGPLDMSGVSDLQLIFDATEGFDGTDLNVQYTSDYSSGCPSGATWTSSQTISTSGNYSIDLSSVSGTDVFIGIQYLDSDGTYSSWTLSNVELAAFGTCPTLGTRPTSNCATCDLALQTANYVCLTNTTGDNNDGVTIEIPYTGSENTITSVSTTSSGTIGGDNPSSVADGTINITGLSEGDAWDLTINGGDCDGTTVSGTVPSSACDPVTTDLIINEILADPDGTTGDANGDGIVDTSQDEFIEIFNIGGSSIDISGYTIEDAVQVRHTFPASTIVPANSFITVFGAGTPTGFTGLVQVASTTALGLNNGGDTVTIKNTGGAEVATYTYGSEAGNNQSIARDPDFTGSFVQHTAITANPSAFSPNTKNDGTALSVNSFELNGVSIYPNPTNTGYVTISSLNSGKLDAQVFDILGKEVLNGQVENNQLNVSNLNAGMYILKLSQNNASITKKLVIQ